MTPAMTLRKLARTVGTVVGRHHIAFVVDVLHICKIAVQGLLRRVRTHACHLDGVAPFQTLRIGQAVHAARHRRIDSQLVLMGRHGCHRVLGYGLVVVQHLRGCQAEVVGLAFVYTAYTRCIAVVRVGQLRTVQAQILHTDVGFKLKVFVELHFEACIAHHLMLRHPLLVINQRTGRVDTRTERTAFTFPDSVVVGLAARTRVRLNGAVLVVQIHRINGRNTVHVGKTVVHVAALAGAVHRRIGIG